MGAQSTLRRTGGSHEESPRTPEEGSSPASASSGKLRHRTASHHSGVHSAPRGGLMGPGRPSLQPQAGFGAGGTYRAGGCSKCLFHMGTARGELPSIGTGRDPELRGPRRAPAPPPPPAPLPRDPARRQSPDTLGACVGLGVYRRGGETTVGWNMGCPQSQCAVGGLGRPASVSPLRWPGGCSPKLERLMAKAGGQRH